MTSHLSERYGTLWDFTFGEKSSGTLYNFITGATERNNCAYNIFFLQFYE